MWVRGLKLYHFKRLGNDKGSHPMWVRGLKLLTSRKARNSGVAPHVGAWIETFESYPVNRNIRVAPHVGAWIETAQYQLL